MSVFYRICPHDQQTCRNRVCCTDQIEGVCPLKVEKPATAATAQVKPLPSVAGTPKFLAQIPCTCDLKSRYCGLAFGGFCGKPASPVYADPSDD